MFGVSFGVCVAPLSGLAAGGACFKRLDRRVPPPGSPASAPRATASAARTSPAVNYVLEWWRVAERDADSLHERVGGDVDVVALWKIKDQARDSARKSASASFPSRFSLGCG